MSAITRSEALVRNDVNAAANAVLRVFPSMDRARVDAIVRLYQPAMPASPHVSVEGFRRAAELFPASRKPPSLEGIDLSAFVDDSFAARAVAAPTLPPRPNPGDLPDSAADGFSSFRSPSQPSYSPP